MRNSIRFDCLHRAPPAQRCLRPPLEFQRRVSHERNASIGSVAMRKSVDVDDGFDDADIDECAAMLKEVRREIVKSESPAPPKFFESPSFFIEAQNICACGEKWRQKTGPFVFTAHEHLVGPIYFASQHVIGQSSLSFFCISL